MPVGIKPGSNRNNTHPYQESDDIGQARGRSKALFFDFCGVMRTHFFI
jgi:hypothetical protein